MEDGVNKCAGPLLFDVVPRGGIRGGDRSILARIPGMRRATGVTDRDGFRASVDFTDAGNCILPSTEVGLTSARNGVCPTAPVVCTLSAIKNSRCVRHLSAQEVATP